MQNIEKNKWKTPLKKTDFDMLVKKEDMSFRGVLKSGFRKDTSRIHLNK